MPFAQTASRTVVNTVIMNGYGRSQEAAINLKEEVISSIIQSYSLTTFYDSYCAEYFYLNWVRCYPSAVRLQGMRMSRLKPNDFTAGTIIVAALPPALAIEALMSVLGGEGCCILLSIRR